MPAVTREQALKQMSKQLENFDPTELVEVHNEVFPDDPATEEQARANPGLLVKRLSDHISSREIDEFVERWHLVFTKYRNVWYNEEEDLIYYTEGVEAVSADEY